MSKLPIPFRRRKSKAEQALELAQRAAKLWATTKAVKVGARASKKAVVAGALLAGGAFAAKKLRGGNEDAEPYAPPAPYVPPTGTTPKPDPGIRESPHGDVAADLLPGDDREAAPGGRNVGIPDAAPAAGGGEKNQT